MKGRENRISSVSVGGSDAWQMMGHVYWDRSFSRSFVNILNAVYDAPETASKLWEDIYIDHLEDLPMVVRKYEPGVIWEFDSLDEVSAFDPTFIQNVDSSILDNICEVLNCGRSEISEIAPSSRVSRTSPSDSTCEARPMFTGIPARALMRSSTERVRRFLRP